MILLHWYWIWKICKRKLSNECGNPQRRMPILKGQIVCYITLANAQGRESYISKTFKIYTKNAKNQYQGRIFHCSFFYSHIRLTHFHRVFKLKIAGWHCSFTKCDSNLLRKKKTFFVWTGWFIALRCLLLSCIFFSPLLSLPIYFTTSCIHTTKTTTNRRRRKKKIN